VAALLLTFASAIASVLHDYQDLIGIARIALPRIKKCRGGFAI
jgi:hypothetical protein